METQKVKEGKRWGGADWATESTIITIVGVGGIGSWTALALSRIDHSLDIIDPDVVDETNVTGGQLYSKNYLGTPKVDAISSIIRDFGGDGHLFVTADYYEETYVPTPITITGLDNMESRKLVFNTWENYLLEVPEEERKEWLFIDGRLLLENMEVFAIRGDDEKQRTEYRNKHLFSDEEVEDVDCTAKQTSFSAMIIAGLITGVVCNFLTNNKLGINFREVPFYQRMYLPLFKHDIKEVKNGS